MHSYGYVKILWIMHLMNIIKVVLLPLNPGFYITRVNDYSNCGNVGVTRVG